MNKELDKLLYMVQTENYDDVSASAAAIKVNEISKCRHDIYGLLISAMIGSAYTDDVPVLHHLESLYSNAGFKKLREDLIDKFQHADRKYQKSLEKRTPDGCGFYMKKEGIFEPIEISTYSEGEFITKCENGEIVLLIIDFRVTKDLKTAIHNKSEKYSNFEQLLFKGLEFDVLTY